MPKRDLQDPFASVEDANPIQIPAGVFRAGGPTERTGSTNARRAGSGMLNAWRASSSKQRMGWLTAALLVLLLVVVIPSGIAMFGSVRKAQLEAEANAAKAPTVVVMTPEAQAVQDKIDTIDVAYLMSNTVGDKKQSEEMGKLLTEAKQLVLNNDAAGAEAKYQEALKYFIGTYSQGLAGVVEPWIGEYWGVNWETEERLRELTSTIQANADGHDLEALAAAVIELPQQLGNAKAQHLQSFESYVPPAPVQTAKPTETPKPTQEAKPTETPKPSQEAKPTVQPKPSTDNGKPGNGNGKPDKPNGGFTNGNNG